MDRKQFDRETKMSVMDDEYTTIVMGAITLYEEDRFTSIEKPGVECVSDIEYIDATIRCLRESLAMRMYGDVRELLFSLQRSMLKSKLGVDEDSIKLLRSIIEYLPDGSFYVADNVKVEQDE